jgi:hypothetical protein
MCAMRKAAGLSILLVVVLLAVAVIAEAQQPKKISRIGYLEAGRGPSLTNARGGERVEAFRQGLRELGYI